MAEPFERRYGPIRLVVERQFDTQLVSFAIGSDSVSVVLGLQPEEAAEIGEVLLMHGRGHTRRVPNGA